MRRRFRNDSTSRVLLSAQSNSAIDHLMDEVRDVFEPESEPLMIRARAADDDAQDGGLELDKQAEKHLKALASSPLAAAASPALKGRLDRLSKSTSTGSTEKLGFRINVQTPRCAPSKQ